MDDTGKKTPPSSGAIRDLAAVREGGYFGRSAAFLTQHGKEKIVAPVLEAALGCRVTHVTSFDTDLLGTFTRDIPRAGTQLEATRKKARLGMELAGLPLGVASEARAEIHRCIGCGHQVTVECPEKAAAAGRCDWCNP